MVTYGVFIFDMTSQFVKNEDPVVFRASKFQGGVFTGIIESF
jgi:hypothetical protein